MIEAPPARAGSGSEAAIPVPTVRGATCPTSSTIVSPNSPPGCGVLEFATPPAAATGVLRPGW